MNLKEAFRYHNFLDSMMNACVRALNTNTNTINITLNHKKQAANSEAQDQTETVDKGSYSKPTTVMALMERLVTEKDNLTRSVSDAKNAMRTRALNPIDIDAALDVVKFMRLQATGLETMLRNKPGTTIETGTDYKFNNEGNQVPYTYKIEKVVSLDFDAATAKATLRRVLKEADSLSADLEAAYVNSSVAYAPSFDVNDTFEDLLATIEAESAESAANAEIGPGEAGHPVTE